MKSRVPEYPRRLAALLLSAGLGCAAAIAQTPEGSAFSDPNSPFNEPNPTLEWSARDRFDRVRFMDAFSTHFILTPPTEKLPFYRYFPPTPPVLDSELPVIAPLDPGEPVPEPMSGFVAETFYPALAARLAANDLPRDMRQRIVSYHDKKIALTGELRARILALKDAEPQEKQRQLGMLAAAEDPSIRSLAAESDNILADLRERNVFGIASESRQTTLPDRRKVHSVAETPGDADSLLKEAVSLMDAAFLEPGLSQPQRKLLFEAATELRQGAATGVLPREGTRVLSFSPLTARIRIPSDLGGAMDAKVRDYVAAKDALKDELRNALHVASLTDDSAAAAMMGNLASEQAAGIDRVERMAEDIRLGLALLPNPPGPPGPMSLPPELAARISEYRAHKVRLLKSLRAMLDAPKPTTLPAEPRPTDDPGASALAWMHDGTTSSELHPSSLAVPPQDFRRTETDMIADLNREQAGIRESLADYVRSANGRSDRKSINDLLRDFEEARSREEIWDKYRDYQTAVLMPGLSSGQRQLLFDTAIGELGLPLPTGERIP
ncbi:MAG TPA: hypothetical protein VFE25_16195 [Opitutaceae bacterium]|jgi:hypothetical protein|nr:hypothetical protein [Opitutaceae bacterium]